MRKLRRLGRRNLREARRRPLVSRALTRLEPVGRATIDSVQRKDPGQ
jgi:hypothetical protein